MRWLGALAGGVAWLTRASVGLAAALMLLCISYQVLMRYVFGDTPSWSEELAVLFFSWSVLGGLALGVHEGWHVRLTLLPELLPAGLRAWTERVTELVTAALGLFLAWSGWRFLDMTSGSVSAAIGYPIEILNILAPICGGLMALFGLERALRPAERLTARIEAAA
ncbi:ABC transporter permease [Siccirubricoccus deserti]|uniref:TRAP transporter small permease protein n=1 Tax=Siccirubricoccus deserti TaxID=2013562 RepID=A0A9X0R0Q0_9PROT|nr:TRAP transporter small permease [Siccirubricoccus deserti]MBC4016642.1 TRAP transporter small permease [Siccirubricoccus deserti]GGC50687.1 ABC transporter permease [Siccirubricoccus deserti]